jgi:hypothetical protein
VVHCGIWGHSRIVHITNVRGDVHVAQHVDSVTGHRGSVAVASGMGDADASLSGHVAVERTVLDRG